MQALPSFRRPPPTTRRPAPAPAPQFPQTAGVYAVYDSTGTLHYLGISRRVSVGDDGAGRQAGRVGGVGRRGRHAWRQRAAQQPRQRYKSTPGQPSDLSRPVCALPRIRWRSAWRRTWRRCQTGWCTRSRCCGRCDALLAACRARLLLARRSGSPGAHSLHVRRLSHVLPTHPPTHPLHPPTTPHQVLELPDASKEQLQEAWKAWVQEAVAEAGAIPPGNAPGQTLWQQRKCVRRVAAAGGATH